VERYIHRPLGERVDAVGGHYVLVKEACLDHEGEQVLYVVGHAAFDSTCCGAGGCGYAVVQGAVRRWHASVTGDGLAVTEFEPVRDPRCQQTIREALLGHEKVSQVTFR